MASSNSKILWVQKVTWVHNSTQMAVNRLIQVDVCYRGLPRWLWVVMLDGEWRVCACQLFRETALSKWLTGGAQTGARFKYRIYNFGMPFYKSVVLTFLAVCLFLYSFTVYTLRPVCVSHFLDLNI